MNDNQPQDVLTRINQVIEDQLAIQPDHPFPLITLPNGQDTLLRCEEDGTVKFLESEIDNWRGWLLDEVHKQQKPISYVEKLQEKGRTSDRATEI